MPDTTATAHAEAPSQDTPGSSESTGPPLCTRRKAAMRTSSNGNNRQSARERREARRKSVGFRKQKAEPSETEFTDATRAFFAAIRRGDVDTVTRMLEARDVHVDGRDAEDVTSPTPLVAACEARQHEIIYHLVTALPRHADVNLENAKGKRPIWWAAKYGDHEIARLLLNVDNQKCEVNYLDKESGCTPLYRSILSNATEVCAELIHAGADVNLRRLGISGDSAAAQSPLIKAVQLNNLAIVDMLVNSLCDMEARTEDGLTALHYAVGYRRYAIARTLLSNRIPINAKSSRGVTAMTVAIEQHDNASMVRLLVEHGYDPDSKFDWGETPLEMAINKHNERCALALVCVGCSLNVDKDKPSYFLQAISEGLMNLVKVLLEVRPGEYLRERWLHERFIPLALYRKTGLYDALIERATNPRPLAAIARSVIFTALGRFPGTKTDKLPLPKKLKDFVKLKKEFPKDLFAETSIYDDDCPFDCHYSCPKPQCPELDFSSSSEEELDL